MQEKELYSKVCVAGSIKFVVGRAREESVDLNVKEKFSRNLATILARDKEVVAVGLRIFSDKCFVYISKNGIWSRKDVQYIEKIMECVKSISKDAPIVLDEAWEREDVADLFKSIMEYCSTKFETRFGKLKQDIVDGLNKNEQHILSFIEYASIRNIHEVSGYELSEVCSSYYKTVKNDSIPEIFLRHLKKVGSYYAALVDITTCACSEEYKLLFSNMNVHMLEPVMISQPIFSWKNIIQRFIPNHGEYEKFKKRCSDDNFISKRLKEIYGNLESQLDNESIEQQIYLHAEMNILTNIIDQEYRGRMFIAMSKRCCYLCELYIKFAQNKGYHILTSGTHAKLYHRWVLPNTKDTTFRNDSLSYIVANLDRIISEEISNHFSIMARTDDEEESENSDPGKSVNRVKVVNLIKVTKPS